MARATAQQMDAARGTVEVTVPASEGKPATKVSKKGAVVQSVVRGAVLTDKEGERCWCAAWSPRRRRRR